MRGVQIYVSDFGTHLLAPNSPMLKAPLRKDGGWNLRTKAGREAAEYERLLKAYIKAAFDYGIDVNAIQA